MVACRIFQWPLEVLKVKNFIGPRSIFPIRLQYKRPQLKTADGKRSYWLRPDVSQELQRRGVKWAYSMALSKVKVKIVLTACAGWATTLKRMGAILEPVGQQETLVVVLHWLLLSIKNATLLCSFFSYRVMDQPGFRGVDQGLKLWSVWSSGGITFDQVESTMARALAVTMGAPWSRRQNEKMHSWDERVAPNV